MLKLSRYQQFISKMDLDPGTELDFVAALDNLRKEDVMEDNINNSSAMTCSSTSESLSSISSDSLSFDTSNTTETTDRRSKEFSNNASVNGKQYYTQKSLFRCLCKFILHIFRKESLCKKLDSYAN